MRFLAILTILAAACGGEGEPQAEKKGFFAEAAARGDLPRYGIFAGDKAEPGVPSATATIDSILAIRAEERAALTPRAAVPEPPVRKGFLAAKQVEDLGDFKVVVEPMEQPSEYRAQFGALVQELAAGLNSVLKLPRDIPIKLAACREANMYYDPDAGHIVICDGILTFNTENFRKYRDEGSVPIATMSAMINGLFHELGHCLLHQYEIDFAGREEDVVDDLATLLMLSGGEHAQIDLALIGAEFWMLMALGRDQGKEELRVANVHAMDEQRYYNILCLVYGQNPTKNQFLLDEGDLPRERARTCEKDYARVKRYWMGQLEQNLQPNQKL